MDLFYELIQASLGERELFSRTPSIQEWSAMFKESERQAILGVMLMGIDVMPSEQRPPKELLLNWIGLGEAIRQQNLVVNQRICQLIKLLTDANQRYFLLKGQGNAMMYPETDSRNAGDIDVWLEGDKKQVVEFVHSRYPDINVQYHHMDFPVFDDVEVEVHYFPSFCYNKIHNKRLKRFFMESSEEQFGLFVK